MGYWLDYSAGTLSAATIKAAGYEGVIRYVTAPRLMNPPGRNPKHTTKAEFDDHRRNGLKQLLVFQGGTTDADTGFSGGVANAKLALEGANYLGYTGPVFFCNDRTTVPNPAAWRAYLDGAAQVLDKGRVGAYGFFNAMDLAVGHASYFWQAGRRSDVRKHVNFWQDNNTQVTVGGITCDRNLPLVPMGGETDDDMTPQEFLDTKVRWWDGREVPVKDILAEVYIASRGLAGKPGFPGEKFNVELPPLRDIKAAITAPVPVTLDLDALAAKVAALVPPVDYAALAKAVNDEAHRRSAE